MRDEYILSTHKIYITIYIKTTNRKKRKKNIFFPKYDFNDDIEYCLLYNIEHNIISLMEQIPLEIIKQKHFYVQYLQSFRKIKFNRQKTNEIFFLYINSILEFCTVI
jgi:hypothetical protein